MNGIDIRLLQAAIAVAEELNFSRAASRLRLTQPALTKQIQDLEKQLGVSLFERNNQGVDLTEPCRIFIEESRLSVLHLERAIHSARAAARGAESILNFGTSPYTDRYLVSAILSVRLPLYPHLRIQASSNFSAELARQVMTGELEIALLTAGLPNHRLNFLQIASSPFFLVMRDEEVSAGKRVVSLKDYHQRVWILFGRHVHPTLYDQLLIQANALGVEPSEIHHVTTAEEAAHLVVQHQAVAFLTQAGAWRVARSGLTMRPLEEEGLTLKTTLVTRADDRTRLTSEFVRATARKLKQKSGVQQQILPLTG